MTYGNPSPRQLSDQNSEGTVLGTPGDKIGFYGQIAASQPGAATNVHTVAAGATTASYVNTTYDGSIGSTAYTVGDLVAALKTLGLIKA